MTSTRTAAPAPATTTHPVGPLLLHGLAAVVAAAVATSLVAVIGRALGIGITLAGAPIPALGFAVLTVAFGLVGRLIALAVRRLAPRPRTAWVAVTVGLTALSLVPDVLADADLATKLLLMLSHVVAAAIVVPVVARRLPAERHSS